MKRVTAQLLRSGYLGCAFLLGLTVMVWQFPGWLAARSGPAVHTHARVDCLAWSADGRRLAWVSSDSSGDALNWQAVDGSGRAQRLPAARQDQTCCS